MFSSVFLVTKEPTGTKSKSWNQNQNQNWILFPPSTGPRTGIKFYLKNKGNGHQVPQFCPEEWICYSGNDSTFFSLEKFRPKVKFKVKNPKTM
jgi:hypothetical protein